MFDDFAAEVPIFIINPNKWTKKIFFNRKWICWI